MGLVKARAVAVASVLLGASCTATTDPPGSASLPTNEPVVLRLGAADPHGRPDTPVVEGFAAAVDELSDGSMRVEVTWEAAGPSGRREGFERGVVDLVQNGDLDLGWIGARAWDTVGVSSLQALQAPFLITDQELLAAVLASPMADEMIAGLDEADVVGLDLFPDGLRYPLGYAAPMVSLADFDGAAMRAAPSEGTDAVIRALGGRPVYGLNGEELDAAIVNGDLDGTDISVALAPSLAQDVAPRSVITGNVVLFPRVNTLFASQDLVASLSDEQSAILASAADEAQAFTESATTEDFAEFCEAGGEVAIASARDVAALQRAVAPVYRMLEADPQTKAFIAGIRALKDAQEPGDESRFCGVR